MTICCILDIDYKYPKGLNKWHNNYHLAPNKKIIK